MYDDERIGPGAECDEDELVIYTGPPARMLHIAKSSAEAITAEARAEADGHGVPVVDWIDE